MKVALIVPENSIVSKEKLEMYQWEEMWEYKARIRLWSTPDLGLLTIAGMMPKDFILEYIDFNYLRKERIECDWAFFSPTTCQIEEIYRIADELRARGIKVAMGGVHVSVLPDEALKHADTIFIGEAEGIFSKFIEDMKMKKTKPLYKNNYFTDLAETPIPRYDLIKDYPYKSVPIQTSRGCPHQCSFCVSSKLYGKKIRRKSISQVAKELESILDIYENPLIFFTDDNIFVDRKYGLELVKLVGSYNIRWYAFSDASIAYKDELLEEISRSGCMQLLIGFESLDEDSLVQINRSRWKRDRLKNYDYVISRIQGLGVGVVGSFVLGMDDDTREYFDKLYEFILKTHIYATNITVLTPFPGTEVYESLKKKKRILTNDWSKYNGFELTFKPKKMTINEFENEYIKLNRRINSVERRKKVSDYFIDIFKRKRNYSMD
ncbi:B12-binding domain-containing radical SAM protein [Wukongibacter sp. M2B1]|uniref:B12-binding domain-containing radical SAM protein n=1 Tax=Wukongibacter sp. M2B1 TaxID=3088895 RepID=UPI003D78D2C4